MKRGVDLVDGLAGAGGRSASVLRPVADRAGNRARGEPHVSRAPAPRATSARPPARAHASGELTLTVVPADLLARVQALEERVTQLHGEQQVAMDALRDPMTKSDDLLGQRIANLANDVNAARDEDRAALDESLARQKLYTGCSSWGPFWPRSPASTRDSPARSSVHLCEGIVGEAEPTVARAVEHAAGKRHAMEAGGASGCPTGRRPRPNDRSPPAPRRAFVPRPRS